MRKGLGYFAPGYLVGSVVLVSLALLPSLAWAAQDEQQANRDKSRPQVRVRPGAQGRQAPGQRSAPNTRNGRTERVGGNAPAGPAAGGTVRGGRGNVFAPDRPQARQVPAPRQVPGPRVSPYGNSRQPGRVGAAPQAPPAGPRVGRPDQPRPNRPNGPVFEQAPPRDRLSPRSPQAGRGPGAAPGPAVRPAQPNASARRLTVPEAKFRGAGSEEKVRIVAPGNRKVGASRFQDWVRGQNNQPSRVRIARPGVDVIGNPVPTHATVLHLSTPSYQRTVTRFGAPGYRYVVRPGAVWGDNFFREERHHRNVVVVNLYYPFYYADPEFVGFSYDGYYPAVYCYFGWSPGWVYRERVYYAPADYVYVVPAPARGHRLDVRGANRALRDIRDAWLDGDIEPLAEHLTDQLDVRVYFEGEYAYTTAADDFYAMTLDTLATVQTEAMDFDDPIWISSHEVFYTGRQVFEDPDGERHTVYVSFRFRNLGGEWYLVAVGTSPGPIEHQYRDFRYR